MSISQSELAAAQAAISQFNVASDAILPGTSGEDAGGSKPSQYWIRPDEWLCIQPSWPTEAAYLYARGFRSLKDRFGVFFKKQAGWDTQQEPWKRIFERGGADVFCVEQILEHGWHRTAPYAGVVFPQIEELEADELGRRWLLKSGPRGGTVHQDVRCGHCGKLYLTEGNLLNHEQIAHRETSANNALGRAIARGQVDAMTAGMGELSGPLAEAIKMLAASQAQQAEMLAGMNEQLAALRSTTKKA